MHPRFLPLLLVAACASKGGQGARGQGEAEEVAIPKAPAGGAVRTARGASFAEVLEDLGGAEVVFVAADEGLRLGVLQYLFARGRLHAVGLETFPRTAQKALDDFSFGRIDEAELAKLCGATADADRPVLAFAREKRLPVLGLGLEQEIRDGVCKPGPEGLPLGLDGLTEEQRRSLRALPQRGFDGPAGDPILLVLNLEQAVAADVVVRWYRVSAPEGAQIAVLAAAGRIAPRERLPEQLFGRNGKTYRTLVALPGTAGKADGAVFAKSYADYVWFTGGE